MTNTVDDLVLYRCAACTRQFFSTAHDPVCPCGHMATLSECQDIRRTEQTLLEELRALRRTIFMLVNAAGGYVEVSLHEMEHFHAKGATLGCYYDIGRNCQVWSTRQDNLPGVK